MEVLTASLNRPGLQLAGFFDYFAADRVQILGKVELTYLATLDDTRRTEVLDRLLSYQPPCVIISRNMEPPVGLLEMARKHGGPILRSRQVKTMLFHDITDFLDLLLA
jgi:HPr kinase/phosphorylase